MSVRGVSDGAASWDLPSVSLSGCSALFRWHAMRPTGERVPMSLLSTSWRLAISLGAPRPVIRGGYVLLRQRRQFWSPWLFVLAALLAVAGYAVQSAGDEAIPIAHAGKSREPNSLDRAGRGRGGRPAPSKLTVNDESGIIPLWMTTRRSRSGVERRRGEDSRPRGTPRRGREGERSARGGCLEHGPCPGARSHVTGTPCTRRCAVWKKPRLRSPSVERDHAASKARRT